MAVSGEDEAHLDVIKKLKVENARLSRELRISKDYFDKISGMIEAKESFAKALEAANARQKAYTDMLLESCPNIILLFDDDKKLILGTKQFLILTGTPNFEYLKNMKLTEIMALYLSQEDMAGFEAAVNRVFAGEKQAFINKWISFEKTQEKRFYSVELTAIGGSTGRDAGINNGIMAVFVDFTDLIQEKERAEAASRAKSDFLAVMSHEIRTPMNAILGFSEILSRAGMDPLRTKYLDDIKKSGHSLLNIINDILDFSKIEAGKLEIVNETFNLQSLLDSIYSMFTVLYKAKGLGLYLTVDENFPGLAKGDENRIRQILTNLLSNALKYTHEGRIDFSAWLTTTEDGAQMIRFDIKDTGIGIHEEDIGKLFRPFEQLDVRKNRDVVGTGLGLAICYRLCQLMGGDLWLKSKYGEGSTFSLMIPYIPAEKPEIQEENTPETGDFTASGAKILVVDDIDINLEVCAAILEGFGIKADLAASGKEALELAAATKYDIIFMDHMMPEMDGMETAARIRASSDHYQTIPIIALTANVINDAESMFRANKFNGLLPKPIDFASMNQCLRTWLPKEKIYLD